MKRLLLAIGLCSILSAYNPTQTEPEFEPEYYPLLMQVTETENNLVTATDLYGHEWQFEKNNVHVNELYSCIMSDNGIIGVEDDIIVKLRHAGSIMDYTSESVVNMETVVDFEVTETGLLLHLENGDGYYFER